jgi:hypothetical protein
MIFWLRSLLPFPGNFLFFKRQRFKLHLMIGNPRSRPVPPGLRLFLGLFILIGLIALGVGVMNLVRSLRCESWPTVEGVIESADMQSQTGGEEGITYSADISYAYQVAGKHYAGQRVAFGARSASSSRAQRVLDRFPVGKKVSVHYSPGDPQLAVLEPGIHGGTGVCFGVGTVFLLFGVVFLQLFSAARRPGPNPYLTSLAPGVRPGQWQQPPVLMGVVFILMGLFVCLGEPADGVSDWIGYAGGGMFVSLGLVLLAKRGSNPLYSKLSLGAAGLFFLAVFQVVSFGPGGCLGTSATPFFQPSGVTVKTWFAAFTVLLDLLLLAAVGKWLWRRRKK